MCFVIFLKKVWGMFDTRVTYYAKRATNLAKVELILSILEFSKYVCSQNDIEIG